MKYKENRDPDKSDALLREKKQSTEEIFNGELLHVFKDQVELPDQSTSVREWIDHPGASAVVPIFGDGTVMLLKQFRYPPRKTFIEVPAGKIDPGEDAGSTAERELLEESGITCRQLIEVGSFYPAIGYANEIIHVFVGWNLDEEAQSEDDDEFLLKYRIPFSEAMKMIRTGEIDDGKTICSLLHAALWWKENAPFHIELGI